MNFAIKERTETTERAETVGTTGSFFDTLFRYRPSRPSRLCRPQFTHNPQPKANGF